ncbi:MAG: transporter substrate-binding domain-containing protein [Clostridia bacterium]|nr:transporter substrate-binding domain-containing protein [Clostridia bacterium]
MKKLITLIVSALLAVTFALSAVSCGNNVVDDEAKLKEAGVVKVGMECNYAPFNWTQTTDENGAVKYADGLYGNGYDVMIAKDIADHLGVTLQIVVCSWDGLTEDLKSGNIDMIIAGMSPTSERKRQIDFSTEYYNSNLVIVCKAGSALASATTLAEVDNASYKIAAQSNTFHLVALENQTSKCQKVEEKDFSTMQTDLSLGAIDGYIAELPTALAICGDTQYTYVPLVNNETGFTTSEDDTAVAVGLRKGSNILSKVNEALAGITKDKRNGYMASAISLQGAAIDISEEE